MVGASVFSPVCLLQEGTTQGAVGWRPSWGMSGCEGSWAFIHSSSGTCHPRYENLSIFSITGDLWGQTFSYGHIEELSGVLIKYSGSGGKLPRLKTREEACHLGVCQQLLCAFV